MIRTADIKLNSREAEYLLTILREHIEAKHAEILSKTITSVPFTEEYKRRELIDELTFIANLNVRVKEAAVDAFPHLAYLTTKI
jgi:hypothetical protein